MLGEIKIELLVVVELPSVSLDKGDEVDEVNADVSGGGEGQQTRMAAVASIC